MKLIHGVAYGCDEIKMKDGSRIYANYIELEEAANIFGARYVTGYTRVPSLEGQQMILVRVNGKYKVVTDG